MLIVHRRAGRDREVDVPVERASTRVADLAATLGEPGRGLLVDGVPLAPELPLAASPLVRGSIVEPLGEVAGADRGVEGRNVRVGVSALELAIVAGPGAGTRWPLATGRHVLGRVPGAADLVVASDTVSARHAELRIGGPGDGRPGHGQGSRGSGPGIAIRDLGSHNGTWLGGRSVGSAWEPMPPGSLARVGAVVFRVTRRPLDHPTGADPARHADVRGRIVVNRPPRPPRPAEPLPVPRPDVVDRGAPRPMLMLLPALLPALAGLVIVAVTGNWLFALLPLLSPLVALAAWGQARHRAGRAGRREGARRSRALIDLRRALAGAAETELARRRAALPDLAEVARRIEAPSRRLWERRPPRGGVEAPEQHDDWLRLNAGVGVVAWSPPIVGGARVGTGGEDAVEEVVAAAARLVDAPVEVDLSGGGVVGIVGEGPLLREAARRLARALVVQAAALHGPADLALTVVAAGADGTADAAADGTADAAAAGGAAWRWTRWLPHHDGDGSGGGGADHGERGGGNGDAALRALLQASAASDRDPRLQLVVVDDDARLAGARSPARAVLAGRAGPVAGIVIAGGIDRLPASCSTVVELRDGTGLALLQRLRTTPGAEVPVRSANRIEAADTGHQPVLLAGLSLARATQLARRLARYVDGDQVDLEGRLPPSIVLERLLGTDPGDVGELQHRWAASDGAVALPVPLGVTEDGPLVVDLVTDGPHALVAGTTGAGKSELLRTWVAGLAATVDPRDLNLVLIDYKGGAAFDACSRLPHTVSVVTDLDEALAARALRCLEAELRRREAYLRDVGVDDLRCLPQAPGCCSEGGRLPRLVVVVDEFAALATELPGFVDSLVDVAQRGRSLGVHLILATQRPAGVVNERLRANVALRIALRVQDRQESRDVVGVDDAAELPRRRPGRAVVRFGPGEVLTMQTARAGTLATLAARAGAAAADLGIGPPRSPWPPPLPARLLLDELMVDESSPDESLLDERPSPEATARAPFCLMDDPDRQARRPIGWDLERGNLVVIGSRGSGTTTTLASVAVALARNHRPDELHLYASGATLGDLDPLARLPHCGGVVHLGEPERVARLVLRLRGLLDERRHLAVEARRGLPRVVVLVDDWTALQADLDEPGLAVLADGLGRVLLEGPAVGIHVALTLERPGGLRPALAGSVGERLVLHLNEPVDARALGLRTAVTGVPGRGVSLPSGLEVQVALPGAQGLAAAVDDLLAVAVSAGGPAPLGTLADRVDVAELLGNDVADVIAGGDELAAADFGGHVLLADGASGGGVLAEGAGGEGLASVRLPVGLGWSTLEPIGWHLRPGEHLLVAGPARSGRTTTLSTVAAVLARLRPDWRVVAVGARHRLPSDAVTAHLGPGALPELVTMLGARSDGPPTVVLVDDADLLDDQGGVLAGLLAAPRSDLIVVAAGRNDGLRGQYGTWLRRVRMSRAGLLLQPDADVDGDLLGVRLPRRPLVAMRPGRGYLVESGSIEVVQVATSS